MNNTSGLSIITDAEKPTHISSFHLLTTTPVHLETTPRATPKPKRILSSRSHLDTAMVQFGDTLPEAKTEGWGKDVHYIDYNVS